MGWGVSYAGSGFSKGDSFNQFGSDHVDSAGDDR
jgi:hypothetical protein